MNFWKDKSPTKGMIYELMKEWKKSKNRFPFCIAKLHEETCGFVYTNLTSTVVYQSAKSI